MEQFTVNDKIRGWLYVLLIFAAPTVTYLAETDVIGTAMVTLLTAYTMGVAALARINLTPSGGK